MVVHVRVRVRVRVWVCVTVRLGHCGCRIGSRQEVGMGIGGAPLVVRLGEADHLGRGHRVRKRVVGGGGPRMRLYLRRAGRGGGRGLGPGVGESGVLCGFGWCLVGCIRADGVVGRGAASEVSCGLSSEVGSGLR